jgi:CHAT domain-containing protein
VRTIAAALGVCITVLTLSAAALRQPEPRGDTQGATSQAAGDALDAQIAARVLAGDGATSETLTMAERALHLREHAQPRDDQQIAASLTRLGTVLLSAGNYTDSIVIFRRAQALHQRTHRPLDPELGRTLDGLGNALRLAGRQTEAAETLAAALAVRTASLDSHHGDVATTLEHLAAVELQQGLIPRARLHVERALAIREAGQPDDPQRAGTFNTLGDLLWFEGQLAKARAEYARAVDLGERTVGPEHPDLALYLRNLADATRNLGEPDRAKAMLERARHIAEARLGATHPEVAWILNDLAVTERNQGDYLDARRHYEGALAIIEARFGAAHVRAATVLHNLALLCERLGDLPQAIQLERRALAIWTREQGATHANVGRASNALGSMYARAGRYGAARISYERALAIRRRSLGPAHRDVATTLSELAAVLMREGRTAEAWTRLSEALQIWERAGATRDLLLVRALATRGALEAGRGDLGQAHVTLEQALQQHEQVFGASSPDVAQLRVALASVRSDVGDSTAALSEAIKAEAAGRVHLQLTMRDLSERMALSYAAERPKGLDLAASIVAVAATSTPRGALSQAQAPAQADARPSIGARDVSLVLDELIRSRGVVLDEMAARNRAESDASLAASSPELTSQRAALAAARQRLANLIVRGPESLTPERYAAVIEQARTRKEEAERALAETSVEFRKELARSHIGLAEVRAALPAGTAVVSFLRYEQHQSRALAAGSQDSARKPTSTPTSVASASLEQAAAPRAPAATQSSIATPRAAATGSSRTHAAAAARSVPSYLAFVLRADAPDIIVVPLGPARAIEASVARWREEIGTGLMRPDRSRAGAERAYRAAGVALRERIWDPLATHLDGAQRLFLVPDGALNLVSFASLPVNASEFLVEQAPMIHYLTAERDVVRPEVAPHAGTGLLALGAPAFGAAPVETTTAPPPVDAGATQPATSTLRGAAPADRGSPQPSIAATEPPRSAPALLRAAAASNCASFASMQFPALPGSLREIEEVARAWSEFPDGSAGASGGVEMLSRRAASERAFKQRAPGHQVLHLATHGFFLGGPCRPTPVEGARAADRLVRETRAVGGLASRAASPPAVIDNPLMLSGLAFAGVNRRAHVHADEDDGILTAEEVAGLDLEGVEWAVLSACDTGIGEIKTGEGVFGLRRAFQIAGVRTVILSLWAVEDRSAMNWMRALYDGRRRNHLDTAEAVRAASLAVLRDRRAHGDSVHPFFWAGFVATGDWR